MKHHFGDLLDRGNGLWTITPNAERWACHYADVADAPADATRLTLTGKDLHWQCAGELAQLRELTLHEPTAAQLAALDRFSGLTALRISHARPKSLAMLAGMTHLRELVLEYVSGVDDLSPLGGLPALQALHLENLRRVHDFSGLGGAVALRELSIVGTLDWNQPVDDFGFLATLTALEHLKLTWFRAPTVSPVLGALTGLAHLRTLDVVMNGLPLEEFAWIEANLPQVQGAVRPACIPFGGEDRRIDPMDHRASMPLDEFLTYSGVFVGDNGRRYERVAAEVMLLGKGERNATGKLETVQARCAQHAARYRALVDGLRATR